MRQLLQGMKGHFRVTPLLGTPQEAAVGSSSGGVRTRTQVYELLFWEACHREGRLFQVALKKKVNFWLGMMGMGSG